MNDRWYNRRHDSAPLSSRNTSSPFAFFGQLPFVAQASHVGWGALAVVTLSQWCGLWPAVALVVFGAANKEWLDTSHLFEGDSIADSFLDFTFWCVGVALGVGLFYLRGGQ
jgi:hypothetical protein